MKLANAAHWVENRLFVFAALTAARAAFVVVAPRMVSSDLSQYEAWADRLIALRFDVVSFALELGPAPQRLLRLGFVALIALSKSLVRDWQSALIALNVVCDAAVGVLLVRLVARATQSRLAAWLAFALYLFCFEIFAWDRWVLSDVYFLLLSFAFFVVVSQAMIAPKIPRWLGATALLVIALLFRPAGVVLIGIIILAAFFSRWRAAEPAALVGLSRAAILGFAVFAVAAALLITPLMRDLNRWPFGAFSRAPQQIAEGFTRGEVIHHRPETYRPPPRSFGDYLILIGDRFVSFFHFVAQGFSAKHNLMNVVYFTPVYLIALVGVGQIFYRGGRVSSAGRLIALLALMEILAFAAFHSLTLIDFDWRYRIPIVPHILLLTAMGGSAFATVASWGLQRIESHSLEVQQSTRTVKHEQDRNGELRANFGDKR